MHRLVLMLSLFLIAPAQTVRVPIKDLQPVEDDVPASEVKKIQSTCEMRAITIGFMDCDIYNGSDDWTMEIETALVTVHDRKGTEVLSRRYNVKSHVPPLTNSTSQTDLGIKIEEGQTWSVNFIAAKGYH